MPWILYLKNNETKEIVLSDGVYESEKQKDRAKGRLTRRLMKQGMSHITVHEKKIK